MGTIQIDGSTPKLTIGNATAEDALILFDGNAQDFHIGLDDTADDLVIGVGSALGTTTALAIDENAGSTFSGTVTVGVDDTGKDVKFFGATSGSFLLWDESADALLLTDSTPIQIGDAQDLTLYHDGSNSYITNKTGALKVATETSGIAITLGHTTSEVTVADNFTVTGTITLADGSLALADLDIDGGTDIGAAIVDADLFIVDDGAGGTNRKVTASRIKTYAGASGDITTIDSILNTDVKIGEDDQTKIDFETADQINFYANNSERLRIMSGGQLSASESGPEVDGGGMTFNHGSDDGRVMSFKNGDVAHGMTVRAETDTYLQFGKYSPTAGGGFIQGFGEDNSGLRLNGYVVNNNADKASNALGHVYTSGGQKSGSDTTSAGANGNIFIAANADNAKFIVDEDGDLHVDGSTSLSAFDSYEDAHLVRALDLSHGVNTIDSKFDKFVAHNHEELAEMRLVGRESDGTPNHFVNVTGMQRLHNGAIWQQYEKHQRLLEAVYDLAKEAVGEEKADAILEKHKVKRLQ